MREVKLQPEHGMGHGVPAVAPRGWQSRETGLWGCSRSCRAPWLSLHLLCNFPPAFWGETHHFGSNGAKGVCAHMAPSHSHATGDARVNGRWSRALGSIGPRLLAEIS